MARVRWSSTRAGAVVSAAALVVGVIAAVPTPAWAAGGEMGELGIKSSGTVYAAPYAAPIVVTTAGGTATFTFEVVNTGTVTSQYNLHADVASVSCDPSGCPSPVLAVTAGSTTITPSITGNNGYYTVPVAAGKTATYTLKVTTPRTGVPDNLYQAGITLSDTAGTQLSNESALVEIAATTGTAANDQFVNGAGQSTVRAPETLFNSVVGASSQIVAAGQGATYTVKLQNDGAVPAAITYHLSELMGCAASFGANVKVGRTDVTARALAGTYETPVLAHGKSTTLTVKLTLLSSPRPCVSDGDDQWGSTASSGASSAEAVLVVNLALGT